MKLVVIKGAGGKAFCCGGDIRGNCHIVRIASMHLLTLLLNLCGCCPDMQAMVM